MIPLHLSTLSGQSRSGEPLYTCPRCQRTGFYAKGLLAHVCHGSSFLDKRRRLTAGELAQAKVAGTSAIRGGHP